MKRSVWLPLAILAIVTAVFGVVTALNQSGANSVTVNGNWTLISGRDADGDVDQADFGHFQACLTGSGFTQSNPNCLDARLDEARMRARAADLLDTLGLKDHALKLPGQLSGGQRQSVGIARALVHNAPFLVLDEPTSAMDFSTEAQLTQRLTQFAQGKTVVLVTHRTSLLSLVNRVIVVDAGRIVADGPRDQILQALQSGKIARAS